MTAVAERAHLAAIGSDLAALTGSAGWRRAQALFGVQAEAPVSFDDLARAPAWLRRSRTELTALAWSAALIAMGPAIASSIDGDWLGELARRAGEPALDRAIALAAQVPGGGLPPVAVAAAEELGFDLMRAALARPLWRYLAWAPAGSRPVSEPLATFCLRAAANG